MLVTVRNHIVNCELNRSNRLLSALGSACSLDLRMYERFDVRWARNLMHKVKKDAKCVKCLQCSRILLTVGHTGILWSVEEIER